MDRVEVDNEKFPTQSTLWKQRNESSWSHRNSVWVRWQGSAESSFLSKAAKRSETVKMDWVQRFARREVIEPLMRAVSVEHGAEARPE